MNLNKALQALADGKKVSRKSLSYAGLYLYLEKGVCDYTVLNLTKKIGNLPANMFVAGDEGIVTRLPRIVLAHTMLDVEQNWRPDLSDILAKDWKIVG